MTLSRVAAVTAEPGVDKTCRDLESFDKHKAPGYV